MTKYNTLELHFGQSFDESAQYITIAMMKFEDVKLPQAVIDAMESTPVPFGKARSMAEDLFQLTNKWEEIRLLYEARRTHEQRKAPPSVIAAGNSKMKAWKAVPDTHVFIHAIRLAVCMDVITMLELRPRGNGDIRGICEWLGGGGMNEIQRGLPPFETWQGKRVVSIEAAFCTADAVRDSREMKNVVAQYIQNDNVVLYIAAQCLLTDAENVKEGNRQLCKFPDLLNVEPQDALISARKRIAQEGSGNKRKLLDVAREHLFGKLSDGLSCDPTTRKSQS